MRPGDRLVCAFIEPHGLGTKFTEWFLHVTIVPWFRLDDESKQVAAGLGAALTPVEPFEARIIGETKMGPRKRSAHLLESASFEEVERRVRAYFHKKRAWLVDETTKKPRQFRPHVTFQGETHLNKDDVIFCDRLYIVEQQGGHKEITGVVEL
jgi:hypothetical protein